MIEMLLHDAVMHAVGRNRAYERGSLHKSSAKASQGTAQGLRGGMRCCGAKKDVGVCRQSATCGRKKNYPMSVATGLRLLDSPDDPVTCERSRQQRSSVAPVEGARESLGEISGARAD